MLGDQFDEYLHRYESDRVLCREGEEGGSFYLIKEGLAQVTFETDEGQTVTLDTLGPGDVFGEMALLGDPSVRSATVTSETSLHCWKFSDEKFEALLETSESFREQVMSLLANRVRESNRRLVNIRRLEQLLYRCSLLFVDLVDRLGPAETAQKTLSAAPSLRTLKSWFEIPGTVLESLLKNADREDLRELPESLQDRLLKASRTLVEEGLDKLSVQVRPPKQTDGDSPNRNPDVLLEEVQSLHERIEEMDPEQRRRNVNSLRNELRELKRRRKQLRREPGRDRASKTMESYLKEINRILTETVGDEQT